MKTVKSFKVGDKVFAKVKGYPAWPAQVVSLSGKKYDVTFYGTGESGCVKPEDLFYYTRHKSQFIKTLKRKDYNDAIDEIEEDISSTGTDGNPNPTSNGDSSIEGTPEGKKSVGNKRKRSTSSSMESIVQPSKLSRNSSTASKEDPELSKASPEDKSSTPVKDDVVEKEDADNDDSMEVEENTDEASKSPVNDNDKSENAYKLIVNVETKGAKKLVENDKSEVTKKVVDGYKTKGAKKFVESDKSQGTKELVEDDKSENVSDLDEPNELGNGDKLDDTDKSVKNDELDKTKPDDKTPGDIEQSEKGFEKDADTIITPNRQQVKKDPKGSRSTTNKNLETRAGDSVSPLELADNDGDSDQECISEKVQKDVSSVDAVVKELDDIRLIPDIHLSTLITYAQHIRKKQDLYKAKTPDFATLETVVDTKMMVLPVKLPSGKFVGLKFVPKDLSEFSSEHDRAIDDEKLAKETLELKKDLSEGKTEAKVDDERIMHNLKCDENDIFQMVNQMIISYKKDKLKLLQEENELFDRILSIKKCLALDNARPKSAIRHLAAIGELTVSQVSLKKHPQFVDTVRRLRRYIGNVSSWALDEDQTVLFASDAKTIRDLAEIIFEKFKALFPYNDDEKFIDKFAEDCREYKRNVQDLTDGQQFYLTAEPNSRKALLDQIYDDLKSQGSHKKIANNED